MLEALLLVAAQAVATPPDAKAGPPSAELLEFLADWSQDEQDLIDEVLSPPKAAQPAGEKSAAAKPGKPEAVKP